MKRIFLLLHLSYACSFAQSTSTATLSGTITDPSDAVVPNAQAIATNTETRATRTTKTDQTGAYRFDLLSPGLYNVSIGASGFRNSDRSGITLTVGASALLDMQLQLGVAGTIDTVESDAPDVEMERTQQAFVIEQRTIAGLPIDRRDYLAFSLLAPGVSDSKGLADANVYRVKQTPDSGLSFYGSNGRGNTVNVDGGESNDSGGGVRPTIGQEGVREFQINRSNYSAEYGGSRGGVINIVTKGGTNTLHGSLFGFFRNQNLDATNPF